MPQMIIIYAASALTSVSVLYSSGKSPELKVSKVPSVIPQKTEHTKTLRLVSFASSNLPCPKSPPTIIEITVPNDI